MPVIKGKFVQQLRDVVSHYERHNAGNPLPLTKFEHEFQCLVHHPLIRQPGQKLSALLVNVPGLQTCFADRANPHLMFVRTASYQLPYSDRQGHGSHSHNHNHHRGAYKQYQLVLSQHSRNGNARDTRNPLFLIKLLVESHGSAGLPLASLEAAFVRKYNQPFPRPPGMKLAHFLDQRVRGVECYHPEPSKPHKCVRATGSSALPNMPTHNKFQHHQQCFVEEEVVTETFEEVTGPEVVKPASRTVRSVRTTKKVRRMVTNGSGGGGCGGAKASGEKFRMPMQTVNRQRRQ